jgi:hypothetical protein
MAHLYNSRAGKILWFARRFGWKELFLKPARKLLAPLIVPRLAQKGFVFRGRRLKYFYHGYNTTWANERCVEIPIICDDLEQHPGTNILEVGNVLSHYRPVNHLVLDKYERGEGVLNQDILEFQPHGCFQRVVSISTFEHIGFDDASESEGGDESRLLRAIEVCAQWLHPGGRLTITVPIGYNPKLDALIRSRQLRPLEDHYLQRTGERQWEECSQMTALTRRYGKPFPYANAILVASFASPNREG